MKLLLNIAVSLVLSSALAEGADLKVRNKFGLQILTPGENCKLDDSSAIKLLYLNCIANREAKNSPQRHLDCMNPATAIGGLILSRDPDLQLPAAIRGARLKLHAMYAQEVAANPSPEAQFESLQAELQKFESCKVRLLFTYFENYKEGELEKNSYESDLADALGLSFNPRTVELLEDFSNQKVLSQEYNTNYSQISEHVGKMQLRGNRLLPTLSQWIDYARAYAFGGLESPLSSVFYSPIDKLFEAYGKPAMTEKTYNGCEERAGRRFQITWKATALWKKSVTSLVPVEEMQSLIVSPLLVDALTHHYYGLFINGMWSSSSYLAPGKKCPNKPIRQDLF